MGKKLHDTSVDPEPIIADLRLRLAERDETVEQQTATAGVAAIRVTTRSNSRRSAVSSSPILVKFSQRHIR